MSALSRAYVSVSRVLIVGTACLAILAAPLPAQQRSAAGLWKAYDNKTKQPKSVIRITDENGKLSGKLEQVFPKPGEDANPKCSKCDGELKDKPLLGLMILWDMKKDGDKWADGRILDPEDGKTYGCKLELVDGGKRLKVRGFMGVSMFGRTEYWDRVE